ncbi:PDR/VanB family oxidoreductase [Streptomyces sp. NPDC051322]|uniref:PDR/VanB family oxidoreductase n=1 Tax=Streptomyces sp. NPDC051322 TaxID=3154645 RepID=UPI00344E1ADA
MNDHEAELTVSRRTVEASGVVSLTLRHPQGAELPPWQPGAHVDLLLPGGQERQYSLCGDPHERTRWRIAVLREESGRGGSATVHDALTEGTTVRVRGPRNHFPLQPAPRYRFVAGGIGITPILPMIAAADAAGAEWTLLYGGRSRSSMAFADDLVARYGDRVDVAPQDETGLLDLDALLGTPQADTLVYCCGPGPLLTAAERSCSSWEAGTLHMERFSPKELPAESGTGAHAFELELRRSGRVLTVAPERSVLDTVREAGIDVLYSCTEGTCGTCETDILEGAADHRDSVLTAAEQQANETMMICVSRCLGSRLVLDL